MKHLLTTALLALTPLAAAAEDTALDRWREDPMQVFEASEISLEDLVWEVRPVVVFAQSPNDPLFSQQMDLLRAEMDELALRDVMVIVDTDPEARTSARLKLRPRAFMLALIGKDGQIKRRKPAPWDVRELSRSIDKMPLRQQEMRDRRGTDG